MRKIRSSVVSAMVLATMSGLSPSVLLASPSMDEVDRQNSVVQAEQSDIHSADVERRIHAFDLITKRLRDHNGFGSLHADKAAESTKLTITELLKAELDQDQGNGTTAAKTESISPDFGEMMEGYIPALIQAILELHDRSSIPLLYNPSILTSGEMATHALAYFGQTEGPHIVKLYKERFVFQQDPIRTSLGNVILNMFSLKTITDPDLIAEVKQVLLRASASRSQSDRAFAAEGLACFHDAEAKKRLKELASNDPWFAEDGKGRKTYIIRVIAERALHGPLQDNFGR